ncbi:unnamed protein product, partial [Meganyctiphanes norvegica]
GPNFQNNGQSGPNFQNNGQPGPNSQNNGQSGPNFQNNGQSGPSFPINGQPGPNFQNNGQSGPNFQNNGQFGPNFSINGQPGPNFQINGQPGPNFPRNALPNFLNNGQSGPNFQNNRQAGPNFPINGQPGPNFSNNGQPGPNFPNNAQPGLNFLNNGQSGPNFSNNGHPGPHIVSPIENNNNHVVISEFPAPPEFGSEPTSPASVSVSDVIHTSSKVYQDNSYAPPPIEGNTVHVNHHVEHHETVHPSNDPLVHPDSSFANAPNNALESHPDFQTHSNGPRPGSPAGHPHPHDNHVSHFNGPFNHPEHPHYFNLPSGPFSHNDRGNVHFAGHNPTDFSGNGYNAVYGPFDASFLQQNPIILNNADTFFTQNLPNLPIFPHSNYEQNRFIFPQGFPQPSNLPLSDSNFSEFPSYPPGTTPGDVIPSSTPSQPQSPSPRSQVPDSFTAQPPPSQQLTIPNNSFEY